MVYFLLSVDPDLVSKCLVFLSLNDKFSPRIINQGRVVLIYTYLFEISCDNHLVDISLLFDLFTMQTKNSDTDSISTAFDPADNTAEFRVKI